MTFKLSNAPCSWGVEFADAANNPPWQTVVEEIQQANFAGMELGPLGYLPTDLGVLKEKLSECQLSIVAGTLFKHLHKAAEYQSILEYTEQTCGLLRTLGAKYMVIISHVTSPRTEQAGQKLTATRLSAQDWQQMIKTIDESARICQNHDITPTLHAHTGSYIEYEDELDRVMADLPAERLSLCVDTGHCVYAGMDPAKIIRRYGKRVAYIHLKDINGPQYQQVIAQGIDFYQAIKQGVFCPLGQGIVDLPSVRNALQDLGFNGWMTVEQDIDPLSNHSPLNFALRSRNYIHQLFNQAT